MSSIRMSAGFGWSGQKRMPEKVVMESWEAIHQENHAGYTRHNSPSMRHSAQEPARWVLKDEKEAFSGGSWVYSKLQTGVPKRKRKSWFTRRESACRIPRNLSHALKIS